MDLAPYGIYHVLTPNSDLKSIKIKNLNKGVVSKLPDGEISGFSFLSGRYELVRLLGEGTYGKTYAVESKEKKLYAVKLLKLPTANITTFIKECIIQIILAETSKQEPNGPYVPILYEVGYDIDAKLAFLRTELLDGNFDKLIQNATKQENDVFLPWAISEIASILDFFYTKIKFNHRDLKGDNIMFQRKEDNSIRIKLIDFGLSCLSWDSLHIEGAGYSGFKTCFKEDRDLSQFIYSIAKYEQQYISERLYIRFAQMLLANVGPNHTCRILSNCSVYGLKDWLTSYNFLNRKNVSVPLANPTYVKQQMNGFRKGIPFKDIKGLCQHGERWNTRKRRCRPLKEKPCREGYEFNPLTRRCYRIVKHDTL